MSLILGSNLKGQQATKESDSHGKWQESKRPRQIIQAHLKFLVGNMAYVCPHSCGQRKSNGHNQNQQIREVYSMNNEAIS